MSDYRGRSVLPTMCSSRYRQVALLFTCALAVAVGAGCSKPHGYDGFPTARAVVDAHVEASRAYDLAADCALRHPDEIARMAALDNREADGYCQWATASVAANATPAERARTRAIYADPVIKGGDVKDDRAVFTVSARDGSYHETVTVVKIDGRWFLQSTEGDYASDAAELQPPATQPG